MSTEPLNLVVIPHHDGYACPFDVSEECVVIEDSPQIVGVGDTPEGAILNLRLKLDRMSQMLAAVSKVIR